MEKDTKYEVGQRLRRIAQGNLQSSSYEEIKGRIFVVTKVQSTRIEAEREDGGEAIFSGYSKLYANNIFELVCSPLRRGGE